MKSIYILVLVIFISATQLLLANTGEYREETYLNRIKIRFSKSVTEPDTEMVMAALKTLRPLQKVGVSDFIIFVAYTKELSSSTMMFSEDEIAANQAVKGIMIDMTRVSGQEDKEKYIVETFKQSLEHSGFLNF